MGEEPYIVRHIGEFSFIADLDFAKEHSVKYEILRKNVQECNRYISKILEIPLASKIFYLERVRYVEEQPRTIEKIYIDYKKVPGIEEMAFNHEPLYLILKREFGLEILQTDEEIIIVNANEKEKQLLNLPDGAEVLMLKEKILIQNYEPLQYTEIISDPDFYRFKSEMNLR